MAGRTTSDGRARQDAPPDAPDLPNVGEIVQRLRRQRGMSLQDAAEATGLSASFLSALERGSSDIALKRLARLARAFGHDVGSLLGYTARRAKPILIDKTQRIHIDRGKGVDYEVVRLPGIDFELVIATLAPGSVMRDEISHQGVDVLYVTAGELTLVYNGEEYPLRAGQCSLFSGGYPHGYRNNSSSPASAIMVVTETVY